MTQPKPEILAAVWDHYRTNAAKRTASKPYKGENWACTLLAMYVPESDLLPADQGRGLKPMTSADAMTRNWWKWKKVYGPELKRLEDANGDRPKGSTIHSDTDTADTSAVHAAQADPLRESGEEPAGVSAEHTEDHSGGTGGARPQSSGADSQVGGAGSSVGGEDNSPPGVSADDWEEIIEQSREDTKRHAEIIAESQANAKMWLVKDYPNRDAVDLGEPRYWILWYDPQHDPKEAWKARGRVRNWDNREKEYMYQSPWQLRPEHIYDGHIKVMFSTDYEENRGFDTEGAMLIEEWEHLMSDGSEEEKYVAAQDPDNMPLANIPSLRSWGRTGKGKDELMHVDDYGWVWDRKSDMEAGEPPLQHIIANVHPALQERLRKLFPEPPKDHPGYGR